MGTPSATAAPTKALDSSCGYFSFAFQANYFTKRIDVKMLYPKEQSFERRPPLKALNVVQFQENAEGSLADFSIPQQRPLVVLNPESTQQDQAPQNLFEIDDDSLVNCLDKPTKYQSFSHPTDNQPTLNSAQYDDLIREHRVLPIYKIRNLANSILRNEDSAQVTIDWTKIGQAPNVTLGWA